MRRSKVRQSCPYCGADMRVLSDGEAHLNEHAQKGDTYEYLFHRIATAKNNDPAWEDADHAAEQFQRQKPSLVPDPPKPQLHIVRDDE